MYKKLCIAKFYLLFLLITFLYVLKGSYASDMTNLQGVKRNTGTKNSSNYQEQLNIIQKSITMYRNDLYQNTVEISNRNSEMANRVISFVGWIATIFGVIIALVGIVIGLESLHSRKRRREAISTLEEAKSYVENKTKEFDKLIKEKFVEINNRSEKIIQMFLEQLTRDMEDVARKAKKIQEEGITTESEKKIELLEKRIKFFEEVTLPDDPKLLYSKAIMFEEKGLIPESLKLLQKVIEIDPEYENAYWQMAWIQLESLSNYEKAIEAYNHLIKLDPKNPHACNNKGIALMRLGEKEEALEWYNKAIELNSEESLYHGNKATVLKDLKKYEKALESIHKAIELNPTYIRHYTIAGRIESEKGEKEKAKEYYAKANKIEKEELNKSDTNESMGLNYFENLLILGDYEEAIKFKSKIENKIKTTDFINILNFLLSCLSFLQNNEKEGFKQIFHILEMSSFKKHVFWEFEDINPFLKSQLRDNIYQACIETEKFLLKKISLEECKHKIQKLKNKE